MKPAYQRLYSDLDRTLLDTTRFTEAIITSVEQLYRVQPDAFQAGMPDFYVHHGSMQYYDFFAHIAALGIDATALRKQLHAELGDGDFLYSDVRPLLKRLKSAQVEVCILSYGIADYQRFKMEFLPELQVLPFVATLEFKQHYIATQNPKPSLLVDDKLVESLPSWCAQFLLDRTALVARSRVGTRLWRINSLQTIEAA